MFRPPDPQTAQRIRSFSQLPLAVGFGVQSAGDVRKIWQYAEGAVVGSAIVRFIEEHQQEAELALKGRPVRDRSLDPKRLVQYRCLLGILNMLLRTFSHRHFYWWDIMIYPPE